MFDSAGKGCFGEAELADVAGRLRCNFTQEDIKEILAYLLIKFGHLFMKKTKLCKLLLFGFFFSLISLAKSENQPSNLFSSEKSHFPLQQQLKMHFFRRISTHLLHSIEKHYPMTIFVLFLASQ